MRKVLPAIISYLFVLLFVYASISKFLTFESFQTQLGQSPLLSAYVGFASYAVLLVELVVVALLCYRKTRLLGLYLSIGLMVAFTVYIYIILNFSDFIPCGCGGILEKLGWTEHLWFNVFFIVLGVLAVIMLSESLKKSIIYLAISTILGTGIVVGLFMLSEEKIHYNNELVRRYLHRPLLPAISHKLDFNSYYIAGVVDDSIYLGNSTSPRHILAFSLDLEGSKRHLIQIPDSIKKDYQSVQVTVNEDSFYWSDGVSGIIQKGARKDWVLTEYHQLNQPFFVMNPLNGSELSLRLFDMKNEEATLAVYNLDNRELKIVPGILDTKIDGLFDTDGQLLYDESIDRISYIYYYRNSYLEADSKLENFKYNKTIDTIQQVPLTFGYIANGTQKKLEKSFKRVNESGVVGNGYVMVKSKNLGAYESETMLEQASILDVYDALDNRYEFSFYFYKVEKEETNSFFLYKNVIIGMTANHIVVCEMKKNIFKKL